MQVTASPVADLTRIDIGQPARVFVPGAGPTARGGKCHQAGGGGHRHWHCDRVSPSTSPRLTAGTPVQVEIETEEHKNV